MIKKLSYEDHDGWLAIRHQYIGGSDAGAVLGMNPYKSPYSLWCEKTDLTKGPEENAAMRDGTYLEQMVADYFCGETGKKVRKSNFTYVNERYPWACANVDRLLIGEDAILECKTTSSFPNLRKFKQGDYPAQWYAQVMHYLAVTERKKGYIAAYNMVDRTLHIFELERDDAEIDTLMKAEKDFWVQVCNKTAPQLDGSEATREALNEVYSASVAGSSVSLEGMGSVFQQRKQLSKMIEQLQEQKDGLDAFIKKTLGTAEEGIIDGWNVTWKPQTRRTVDWKTVEKNGILDMFAPFTKVSETRTLRISEKTDKKVKK